MNRLIQWFAENSIAANLLMIAILVGAWFGAHTMQKEVFPTVQTNFVDISMSYPGAGPREVEQQITVRIEEAIADLSGIEEVTSSSRQGLASVSVEVEQGQDPQDLLNDIKARVDAIITFPGDAERPIIRRRINRTPLMFFALYGDVDERLLKQQAQLIRDDLALLDGVSEVVIDGERADEISIEISEQSLRRYNLSFDQVAEAIRRSSLNLPAGVIKTDKGDIQVQSRGQAYRADDFENIVIRSDASGSQLKLADVAEVHDGFADVDQYVRFNGKRTMNFRVLIADNPDLISATEQAHNYLMEAKKLLPPGLDIEITYEMKQMFDGRLNLLLDNTVSGLILVFIVLMLFLRPALAIWVCVGIATAFCGALWLLDYFGVSLNMISMFAFLMVLGIIVDDAIIVGESIYTRQQHGMKGTAAAAGGTKMVSLPVFFAVISTMIFFLPFLDVPPAMAPMTKPLAIVVVLCLLFSLIESLLILPAHLAHLKPERPSRYKPLRQLAELRGKFAAGLAHIADNYYQPLLDKLLRVPGTTICAFLVAFLLSLSILIGGWFTSSFFPKVPNDFVMANITLPEGVPFSETERIARKVAEAAESLRSDAKLGEMNAGQPFMKQVSRTATGTTINIFVGLEGNELRSVSAADVANRWRELVGPLPEAKSYSLDYTINNTGADISLNMSLRANDLQTQQDAVDAVTKALAAYPGVFNVRSSLDGGRVEVELGATAYADTLGISLRDIARQVRQGFYGEEVQRIPREREDVKVMLRYPEAERTSLDQLGEMRVRAADGTEIPLESVANINMVPGFTEIQRIDRRRNITITAELEEDFDALATVRALKAANLTNWQRQFSGFELDVAGAIESQAEFGDSVGRNFMMSVLIIYALMAVAFRSYAQPLLVLTAIPFGFMGAIIGHLVTGEHNISMMSILGFMACAGVVVNDNLVLLDRINQLRAQGHSVIDAVRNAGRDRFRAIILTSLTTFIGLTPILFEQSTQARFLQPMVISLAFGVLFATFVTLLLVPTLYLTGSRIGRRIDRLLGREPAAQVQALEEN